MIYVASLAQCGRAQDAETACIELKRAKPDLTLRSLDSLPFAKETDRSHVAEGLRNAGLPVS
jgi:hypothetical protein